MFKNAISFFKEHTGFQNMKQLFSSIFKRFVILDLLQIIDIHWNRRQKRPNDHSIVRSLQFFGEIQEVWEVWKV